MGQAKRNLIAFSIHKERSCAPIIEKLPGTPVLCERGLVRGSISDSRAGMRKSTAVKPCEPGSVPRSKYCLAFGNVCCVCAGHRKLRCGRSPSALNGENVGGSGRMDVVDDPRNDWLEREAKMFRPGVEPGTFRENSM